MRILCLVLARGGSKRLKNKNILPLGNRPLIHWTIDIAKRCPTICDVLVSTDSKKIADISSDVGGLVPWLRPSDLALDSTPSSLAALHGLDWYEKTHGLVDGLLLLQPTSPFRTLEMINQGINLFSKNHGRPVIAVQPIKREILVTQPIDGIGYVAGRGSRVENLPGGLNFYTITGSFYLVSPEFLRANHSFFAADFVPLEILDKKELIDIDTEEDYELACLMARL